MTVGAEVEVEGGTRQARGLSLQGTLEIRALSWKDLIPCSN